MPPNRLVTGVLMGSAVLVAACTISLLGPRESAQPQPTSSPEANSTGLETPTFLPTGSVTEEASPRITVTSTATPLNIAFCEDPQALELVDALETAIRASDGAALAALVSPDHGMDARLFRDGRIVNYDREHAAALFESDFPVNWGAAPGSGLQTSGSFRELLVPDLLDVLTKDYEVACDQVRVGGTTYTASWPYPGIHFLALHFPGTQAYGGLDWHTWLLGMHNVGGRPYLYALMQFKWEP